MLIDSNHSELSISRQCGLVSISRSTFYYDGLGESELTLELMRRIDEQFLETPFYRGGPRNSDRLLRWIPTSEWRDRNHAETEKIPR